MSCAEYKFSMASKILIIAPSWLGDIIMSQSLLKVLKQQHPEAQLCVYAPAYAHSILERMDEIDEILTNPFAHKEFNLAKRYSEGRRLQAMDFTQAYILPNSFKSALMPFFAHIKERIGFKGESRYIVLNRMRSDKKAFTRMVERYVALAYIDDPKVIGSNTLPTFPYPKLQVNDLNPEECLDLGLSVPNSSNSRPWIALGCGANYGPSKLWPVEYFATVSAHFIAEGFAILAIGSAKDKDTIAKIAASLKEQEPNALEYFHDLAGKTNLTTALDLVGHCHAAVCNDSGLMHTVAAADVPQVCIFGSTSTQYTPPLSEKAICIESTQPCHPCFARICKYGTYQCQKELIPEQVISKLHRLLELYPK